MTQGIQQERGFQITQAFLPSIQAVFAHPKHPANRIDPRPFVERLHDRIKWNQCLPNLMTWHEGRALFFAASLSSPY
jgi:hypothetical protein